MPTREQLQKELDAVPDDQLDNAQIVVLEPNGSGSGAVVKAKKLKRLSFSAIGKADPPDGAKRFEELLGRAIDQRNPTS
jgi:hypothetical protein